MGSISNNQTTHDQNLPVNTSILVNRGFENGATGTF
jgi:hypothetical protein